ncbi:MAG: hypothetical protein U0S76_05125 [Pseudoxanthomonas sp.]|nr:hypothetical protein [Pseudoxanthomonas sp.]
MCLFALLSGLVALAGPTTAAVAGAEWRLDLVLAVDGEPVGNPVLGLRAGEPARIELAAGARGYRVEARLEEVADAPGRADLSARLWWRDGTGGWRAVGAPQVRVEAGQPFSVALADGQGRGYRLAGTVARLPAGG